MNLSKSILLSLIQRIGKLFYVSLFILLAIGENFIYAQTTEIDSLRTVLNAETLDAERYSLMNELSNKLNGIDSKRSLCYAEQALEIARNGNNKEKEIKALFVVGSLIYDSTIKEFALSYFEEGERLANEFGYKQLQADFLMKLAKWHWYQTIDSTKTVNFLLESVKVSKAANYHYGTGRSFAKLASFYTKYNQIELIEEYLESSAFYYLKTENGGEEIAHYYDEVGNKVWDYNPKKSMDFYLKGLEYSDIYPNIKVSLARVHSILGEHKRALKYLKPAIVDLRKMEYTRMLGISTALLAEIYVEIGEYEEAIKTCDEGIALLSSLNRRNQRALPAIYRIKGLANEYKGNDAIALKCYETSLDEGFRLHSLFEKVKSFLVMGKFYSSRDKNKAKMYCEKSLKNARKDNFANLEIKACDCLYAIYKEEKESTKALKYFEQKTALSDSLSTLELKHALEINNKISAKDKQIAEQAYQKEIHDEQLSNQYRLSITLLMSSIIGFLLIGFLTLSIKRIRKQNKEITSKTDELENANQNLGQSNEELESFAYIASHDLKSPLRSIIAFTQLLRNALNGDNNPKVNEYLDFIETSGERMNQLIGDILAYSKLSHQEPSQSKHEVVNLNKLIDDISLLNNSEGKSLNIDASVLPELRWNYSKLFLLFKNLIENGLKYNESEEPCVKLYFTNIEGIYTVYVADNGIGIKQEYFDKIFDMFRRLHTQDKYEGTGLGLATCKKIVGEFGGKISISSEIGKGTTFKIEFPNHLINQHTAVELASY